MKDVKRNVSDPFGPLKASDVQQYFELNFDADKQKHYFAQGTVFLDDGHVEYRPLTDGNFLGNGSGPTMRRDRQAHPTAFDSRCIRQNAKNRPIPSASPAHDTVPWSYAYRLIERHDDGTYTSNYSDLAVGTDGRTSIRTSGLRAGSTREMICRQGIAGNDGAWAVAA